jgi:hypothetical protein
VRPPARDQGHDNGSGGERDDGGNWEAPSFLKRPMPAIAAADEGPGQSTPPERAPRGRRPRSEAPPEDMPQGE